MMAIAVPPIARPIKKRRSVAVSDSLVDGGGWVFEQGGEAERRDHEQTQANRFDQVFRPVVFESIRHALIG